MVGIITNLKFDRQKQNTYGHNEVWTKGVIRKEKERIAISPKGNWTVGAIAKWAHSG